MMQVPDDDRLERQLRHLNLDAAEFTFTGALEKHSHLTSSWSQAANNNDWDFVNTSTAFRSNPESEARYQYSPPSQQQQWSDGSHHSGGSGIWGDDHSRVSQTSGSIPSFNPSLTDYLSKPDLPLNSVSNQEGGALSERPSSIRDFRSLSVEAPSFSNLFKGAQLDDHSSSYFDSNTFSSSEYFGSVSNQSMGSIPGLVPSSSSITSAGSGWKSQSHHSPTKQSSLTAVITAAVSNSSSFGPPPGFISDSFAENESSERSIGSRDNYDGSNRRRSTNSKGIRTANSNNRRPNGFRNGENQTMVQSVPPSDSVSDAGSMLSSQAILQLMRPESKKGLSIGSGRPSTISEDFSESNYSLTGHYFDQSTQKQSILPQAVHEDVSSFFGGRNQYYGIEQAPDGEDDVDFIFGSSKSEDEDDLDSLEDGHLNQHGDDSSPRAKKREWLLRMNKKLAETPVRGVDPAVIPLTALMNSWAKTKSANGASMVEMLLMRAEEEHAAGNAAVVPTTKMFTMAGKKLSCASCSQFFQ